MIKNLIEIIHFVSNSKSIKKMKIKLFSNVNLTGLNVYNNNLKINKNLMLTQN